MDCLLKKSGTTKGMIGELLAREKLNPCYNPKLIDIGILSKFNKIKIPQNIKNFLFKYWHSLDLIKFKVDKDLNAINLILYEVKTSNHFAEKAKWKFRNYKLTENQLKIYKEAVENKFEIYSVRVIFEKDWHYTIKTFPFKLQQYRFSNGNPKYSRLTRQNR